MGAFAMQVSVPCFPCQDHFQSLESLHWCGPGVFVTYYARGKPVRRIALKPFDTVDKGQDEGEIQPSKGQKATIRAVKCVPMLECTTKWQKEIITVWAQCDAKCDSESDRLSQAPCDNHAPMIFRLIDTDRQQPLDRTIRGSMALCDILHDISPPSPILFPP